MIATCLRQSNRPVAAGISPDRLGWIDELRAVAILVMVVDHGLLFFMPENTIAGLFRGTITRCAEPLFVFAFTAVMCRLNRPMRLVRWLQIALGSVATSTLLSLILGYAVADILVTIAVIAPIAPLLLSLPKRICIGALYVASALSVFPMVPGIIAFDYSPMLIIYQVLLSRLLLEEGQGIGHGVISAGVVIVAGCGGLALGLPFPTSVLVVCFGHPIAALAIVGIRPKPTGTSAFSMLLGSHPLKLYMSHLAVFAVS